MNQYVTGAVIKQLREKNHDMHSVKIEKVEDEYFVTVNDEMTKNHYISFIAAASTVACATGSAPSATVKSDSV